MEIHTPDHPLTGWKETAKHLAIVTVGVLIALALEGLVAWADHRLLVREAIEADAGLHSAGQGPLLTRCTITKCMGSSGDRRSGLPSR